MSAMWSFKTWFSGGGKSSGDKGSQKKVMSLLETECAS